MSNRRIGHKGVSLYGSLNPNWRGRSAEKECPVCKSKFSKPTNTCSSKCGQVIRSSKIRGNNNPFSKKYPKKERNCLFCKATYKSNSITSKGYGKHFCSDTCRVKGLRKSPRQLRIFKLLKDAGFNVSMEKSWPWLHRPNKIQRMRVDLWLPEHNLAIEYDGEHHHQIAFGNNQEKFNAIKDCDYWKTKLLEENNIKLIRLSGWPVDIVLLINEIKAL